jgi:predicted transglutaminase-like cysteine proteinase
MRRFVSFIMALALSGGVVFGPAAAPLAAGRDSGGPRLPVGHGVSAPLGFLVFCVRYPAQCRSSGQGEIALDNGLMARLQSVNRSVNRSIRPQNDRGDVWEVNVRVGDCEDYALTKRARLIEMGLPVGALRIATARTRSGAGHAVLVVRTDRGDLVLDNLTNTIRPWNETGLRWVAMSGANPRRWTAV